MGVGNRNRDGNAHWCNDSYNTINEDRMINVTVREIVDAVIKRVVVQDKGVQGHMRNKRGHTYEALMNDMEERFKDVHYVYDQ